LFNPYYTNCFIRVVISASIIFDYESSIPLRRLGNYLPDYTIAKPKISRFKLSLLWKPQNSSTADDIWSVVMACPVVLCVILPTREDSEPCKPFHCIQIIYAQYQYVPFCDDSGDIKSWYGNEIKVKFPLCTLKRPTEEWRYMSTHS